jgi:hypothetical protein
VKYSLSWPAAASTSISLDKELVKSISRKDPSLLKRGAHNDNHPINRLVVQRDDALLAMDIIHTHVLGISKHPEHTPIVQNSLMKGKRYDMTSPLKLCH